MERVWLVIAHFEGLWKLSQGIIYHDKVGVLLGELMGVGFVLFSFIKSWLWLVDMHEWWKINPLPSFILLNYFFLWYISYLLCPFHYLVI